MFKLKLKSIIDIVWLSMISEHDKMNFSAGYYAITPVWTWG